MTVLKLTPWRLDATDLRQTGKGVRAMQGAMRRTRSVMAGALMVGALGGCINVAAPDEPIVIELNINIRSEVICQLAEDTAQTIEENADIF